MTRDSFYQLLDILLGKGHEALFRRAELKILVDFHGNEVYKCLDQRIPSAGAIIFYIIVVIQFKRCDTLYDGHIVCID